MKKPFRNGETFELNVPSEIRRVYGLSDKPIRVVFKDTPSNPYHKARAGGSPRKRIHRQW